MSDKARKKGSRVALRILRRALCLVLAVLLLPLVLVLLLRVPSVQQAAADKAARILCDRTGYDAGIGSVRIKNLLDISLRDLHLVDAERDTLLRADEFIVNVSLRSLLDSVVQVREVRLQGVVVDGKSLLGDLSLKGGIGYMSIRSDSTSLVGRFTMLNSLLLRDADITLGTSPSEAEDTLSRKPFDWQGRIESLRLERVRYAMPQCNLDVRVESAFLKGALDIANMRYIADTLLIDDASVMAGGGCYALRSLRARGGMDGRLIDVPSLSVQSAGASLEGRAALDLNDVTGSADYDLRLTLDEARAGDFFTLPFEAGASGSLDVSGHGISPESARIKALGKLPNAYFSGGRLADTEFDLSLEGGVAAGTVSTTLSWSSAPPPSCDSLRACAPLYACGAGSIAFSASRITSSRPCLDAKIALGDLALRKDNLRLEMATLGLDASISRERTSASVSAPGLGVRASAQGHLTDLLPDLKDIPAALPKEIKDLDIDALTSALPLCELCVTAQLENPAQSLLESLGVGFDSLRLDASKCEDRGFVADISVFGARKDSLRSDLLRSHLEESVSGGKLDCDLLARIPSQLGIPAIEATAHGYLGVDRSQMALHAACEVRDSIMGVKGIGAAVGVDVTALYDGSLAADGTICLDGLEYASQKFGDRKVVFCLKPLEGDKYDLRASTDRFPAATLCALIPVQGLGLEGEVAARARLCGPLDSLALSAEIEPSGLRVRYDPLGASLGISDAPIHFRDMAVLVDSTRITGLEGTTASLGGRVDLRRMDIDLALESGRFVPLSLTGNDSIPVDGNAEVALSLRLLGPVDSLRLDGDVSVLPQTRLTCSLGKDSYVKAGACGDLHLDYSVGSDIALKGRVKVIDGQIKYMLPFYPLAPFDIDSDSRVDFDGPLDAMMVRVGATQKAKAIVSDTGERTRNVDFIVGLQIGGSLKDLGLHFTMQAPADIEVQREIDRMSVEDRDRIAAALLATGMYTSETNAQVNQSGYALASILQRGLNTIAANRLGNIVDVDIGVGTKTDGSSVTQDYTMKLSKTFFNDRLRLSVGGTLSSNSDLEGDSRSRSSEAGLDEISAEYMISDTLSVYAFHKQDYENVMDGDLFKEGIGVRSVFRKNFGLEGEVSYRSNMQLGPSLAAIYEKTGLLGKGDSFNAKLHGAYYWKVVDRHGTESDNFTLGASTSLSVPFKETGARVYNLGYLHEKVASDYRRDKISASLGFRYHPSQYIWHEFSPFTLSFVNTSVSEDYLESVSENKLVQTFLDDEFVPAMSYKFTYDNYADRSRGVNTSFSAYVKESGNLISGVQALCGRDFDEQFKVFGTGVSYEQFLKAVLELRNNFAIGQKCRLATRLLWGSNFAYGNSEAAPMSEQFYSGGPNSIRAFAPRSIGPGGYLEPDYDMNFYHAGDVRLEANVEFRFPLFWMLEGAVFVDAGNVWDRKGFMDGITEEEIESLRSLLGMKLDYDVSFNWRSLPQTTALGTGFGVRLVYQSIVIRLDTAFPIHYPYDTGVSGYYNVPKFFPDGVRLNFGIGYPF